MENEISLGALPIEHYNMEISKRERQEAFKKCNLDRIINTSLDDCDIAPYENLVKDGQD